MYIHVHCAQQVQHCNYIRLIENNRHAAIVYKHDSSVQPCTLENIRILKINGYLSNVEAA